MEGGVMYVVVERAEDGGYDQEESYVEHWGIGQVIGPFGLRVEAEQYEKELRAKRQFDWEVREVEAP